MRFGLGNLAPRTLRFRLMMWNTAVVLLMVIPALALVREVLRQRLLGEFDQLLLEDAEEIKLAVKQRGPDLEPVYREMDRLAEGHAHRGWFVQFCDDRGRLLHSSPAKPALEAPAPRGRRIQVVHGEDFGLAQFRLAEPGQPPLIVRVGASLGEVRDDIDLITTTMILAAGLILVLAPLGGYLLAVCATRPVAEIIELATRARPDSLHERLPLRNTGDELDQLSRTINFLLDSIAAYVAQKRDFIANAAHELRSPLAAISSTVQVALGNPRSPEEYDNLLADILEECNHLGVLVNQLLLLAESDAVRLALRSQMTRLDEVVRRSLAMFQGVAEVHGIELQEGLLPAVLVPGDENHLRQVVNNLIDNAIKFTPRDGRVRVEAEAVGRQVALRVSDTGVGMTAEELPRIFERFYRGDRSRQREGERGGTGLGLSICQAIVLALQGTIAVNSSPGQGSEFTVTLPLAEAALPAHQGGAPGQARAEAT